MTAPVLGTVMSYDASRGVASVLLCDGRTFDMHTAAFLSGRPARHPSRFEKVVCQLGGVPLRVVGARPVKVTDPATSALMRIQRREGVPASGVVDERTVAAATRLGFLLAHHSHGTCSSEFCQNKPEGPLWLVVFDHGRFGAFVSCCRDHPLDPDSPWQSFPFAGPDELPDTNRAFRLMEEMRAVHDVMTL